MKKLLLISLLFLLLLGSAQAGEVTCTETYGDTAKVYKLATGSPGELGMLKVLAENFNAKHGTTMCWVKAGSGKSLSLLQARDVDLCMVHAPAAEKKAVADGWAVGRTLIGSNEFYIVGPKNDPAGIAKAADAADAYARIAKAGALFLSRGDNSGTHKKELAVWKKAGIKPEGKWYVVTKDFMMATLLRANAEGGYFMTDSSTWVAGKKDVPDLTILFRGDPMLINTYHALAVPEGAPNHDVAMAFIEFVGSAEGQKLIADYGKDLYGEGMYNDAEYAKQYDH
ncbi:substrate-binding domain-containing protein [Pseudodesulfovibrio indicus]|uniref:ABC transporter substrate-binding protein n=1 Tax=Pseudodesulfovibrio indicus TaxID=1716143 RepID=A0A126QPA4_9BACT|nr:substrate-binding domain-containing protein [Pseudodesulfovibrio indicus]AMK11883.1 ABC transporter substrate-binding protein [Pseudodesulfovibrio indicus]TDT87148.1 tungstate transport system substrate-binding protein [Pseudodesulfovibrio indicus]